MNRILPPSNLTNIYQIPASTLNTISEAISTAETIDGQISQDGQYVWFWCGPLLEVLSHKANHKDVTDVQERVASWHFGASCNDRNSCIVVVKEFGNKGVLQPDHGLQLLVVVQMSSASLLCLFDVRSCRVIRSIDVSSKITSVEVISRTGGATCENLALCHELRSFFGLVAVGLMNGSVLIIDLMLDESTLVSNENDPSSLLPVSESVSEILNFREVSVKANKHLCIYVRDDQFLRKQQNSDAYIVVIKYIRQLASLLIGYSSGCFQIWNSRKMKFDFTYVWDPGEVDPLPVMDFLYQEPENDPRNFCYIWAIRNPLVLRSTCPSDVATAHLFSVTYNKKSWLNNYGILYEDFQSCIPRFEHDFTCDPYDGSDINTSASNIIKCVTLHEDTSHFNSAKCSDESLRDDEGIGQDYGRVLFVWEAWPANPKQPTKTFFAIFDINQWYPAQMPYVLRLSASEFSSYFGAFSLDDVVDKVGPDSVLDLRIDVKTIERFNTINSHELHFYPLSLSFDAKCLTESKLIGLRYQGLQSKLLHHMQMTGPKCLLDPKELSVLCSSVGVHVRDSDLNGSCIDQTVTQQRQVLLTVALEHNLTGFLSSCIQQWSSSEFIPSGLSLKFFLEWTWKQVTVIKKNIDSLCIPLFNCSGAQLGNTVLSQLYSHLSHLKRLSSLFSLLINQPVPTTEQGLRQLQSKHEATDLIASYLQAILWCHEVGLLPDNIEGEEFGENEIAFPASVFDKLYVDRRSEIKNLSNILQETDLLLIDGMMNHLDGIGSLWEKERNTCTIGNASNSGQLYPPPSIHSMLSIYLVNGISVVEKNGLFLYMLLDMAEHLAYKYSHIVERLMKFPAAFNMEASHVSLIQAFWLLDHCMFEDAMIRLLNPSISLDYMLPWQHTRIIKSFLYQGECKRAFKYCRVRKPALLTNEDIKLHLTLLLANGLVDDAFNFQRSIRDEMSIDDLLDHFYLGCQQTKNIGKLLQLPLSVSEEESLIKFLSGSSDIISQELLVMHYLQKGQILEAINLNQTLNVSVQTDSDPKIKNRMPTRNAIVDGYVAILPNIQRKMLMGWNNLRLSHGVTCHKEARPVPLSATVKPSNANITSHSTLVAAVMEKVHEANQSSRTDETVFTPFRQRKNSRKLQRTPTVNSDSIPFIGTPITSRKLHLQQLSPDASYVVFSKIKSTLKDVAADNNELCGVSPPKRAKHYTGMSPVKSQDRSRISRHTLAAEILSVLQTPIIHRERRSSILGGMPGSSGVKSKPCTPQSILKIRKILRQSITPVQPLSLSMVCDYAEPVENDDEMIYELHSTKASELNDVVATPKHLRFNLLDLDNDSETESDEKIQEEIINELSAEESDESKRTYPKEVSPLSTPKSVAAEISGEVVEDKEITLNYSAHRLHNKTLPEQVNSHPMIVSECEENSLGSEVLSSAKNDDQEMSPKTSSPEPRSSVDQSMKLSLTEDDVFLNQQTDSPHTASADGNDSKHSPDPASTPDKDDKKDEETYFSHLLSPPQLYSDKPVMENPSTDILSSDGNVVSNDSVNHNIDQPIQNIENDPTTTDLMVQQVPEVTLPVLVQESSALPIATELPDDVAPALRLSSSEEDEDSDKKQSIEEGIAVNQADGVEIDINVRVATPTRVEEVTPSVMEISVNRRATLRSASVKDAVDSSSEVVVTSKSSPKRSSPKANLTKSGSPSRKQTSLDRSKGANRKQDLPNLTPRTTRLSSAKVSPTNLQTKHDQLDVPQFNFPVPTIVEPAFDIDKITPSMKSFIFSPPLTRSRTRRKHDSATGVDVSNASVNYSMLSVDSVVEHETSEQESPKERSATRMNTRSRKKLRTESSPNRSIVNFESSPIEQKLPRKKAAEPKRKYLIRTRRVVRLRQNKK